MNGKGQLLLPGLAAILLLWVAFVVTVVTGQQALRQMHAHWAAEAAALSAARTMAERLNGVALENLAVNDYLLPKVSGYAALLKSRQKDYARWRKELRRKVHGIRTEPPAVGGIVARANGAPQDGTFHFPLIMNPLLMKRPVQVLLYRWLWRIPIPVGFASYDDAYYVRGWSTDVRKAQPPHTTTWWVRFPATPSPFRDIALPAVAAKATSKLWLDVDDRSYFHNGGFPRSRDSFLGDIGVQCFYPQFNARLAKTASLSWERMQALWARHRPERKPWDVKDRP